MRGGEDMYGGGGGKGGKDMYGFDNQVSQPRASAGNYN